MILRESATLIIFGILAIVGIIGYASSFWLGHDNKVEETCEVVIESQTGVDLDLTPSSPEPQKTADDIVENSIIENA